MSDAASTSATPPTNVSLRSSVGRALPSQVIWAILAAIWNFAGVYLIANGQQPLGPTATNSGAITLLVIAVGFVLLVDRWPLGYLLLSIATGLIGLGAVVNALTGDPALWPSEFWRFGGAALNAVALIAGLVVIVTYFRWRREPK